MSYIGRNFRGFRGTHRRPDGVLTKDYMRQVAPSIFASDKHDSRSERYTYIPTIEVVQALGQQGFVPVFATQGRCRIEGKSDFTKHMIRFRKSDAAVHADMDVGTIFPEVCLVNSHDGTSRYHLMSGLHRSRCKNGLVCSVGAHREIHIPHKGDVIPQVIEGTFEVLDESIRTMDGVREWSRVDLNRDEQMAMAEAARVVRFGDSEGNVTTPIQADQMLQARRYEDNGNSLWLTFNRLQESAIRGGMTAIGRTSDNRPRRVTAREVRGIDGDVKINRALWLLSERMAELKGAA